MFASFIPLLRDRMVSKQLDDGEFLFHQGDVGDTLYIVEEGQIDVVVHHGSADSLTVNQIFPGQFIGEMAVIEAEARSAGAVAVGQTRVQQLKQADFFDALEQHPAFAFSMIRELSSKLRFATTYIEQATEWSQQVAQGNYQSVKQEIVARSAETDSAERAARLLSTFFAMTDSVQNRETAYQQEVQKLRIEIDVARQAQAVAEITDSDEFEKIAELGRMLRAKRQARGVKHKPHSV